MYLHMNVSTLFINAQQVSLCNVYEGCRVLCAAPSLLPLTPSAAAPVAPLSQELPYRAEGIVANRPLVEPRQGVRQLFQAREEDVLGIRYDKAWGCLLVCLLGVTVERTDGWVGWVG